MVDALVGVCVYVWGEVGWLCECVWGGCMSECVCVWIGEGGWWLCVWLYVREGENLHVYRCYIIFSSHNFSLYIIYKK